MKDTKRVEAQMLDVYAVQRLLALGKLLRQVLSQEEVKQLKYALSTLIIPKDGAQEIGNAGVS